MGDQASAVFFLPSAAQRRTTAEKGRLHLLPGRHPSPTRVIQHLRIHGPANGRPYGRYGRAEAVCTLTQAHSVCGLAANVLGLVPFMPLFLLGNYVPSIPHQLRQHRAAGFHIGWQMQPTSWAGREATSRSNVYEINQCGSWAGQTASGGPVGG